MSPRDGLRLGIILTVPWFGDIKANKTSLRVNVTRLPRFARNDNVTLAWQYSKSVYNKVSKKSKRADGKTVGSLLRYGKFSFCKKSEKKPKKDEKTPQLFFMGDIDNKNAKCYN